MILKWGIAGAGKISHDFVEALRPLSKKHHQIIAVADLTQKAADEFASKHSIPKGYNGFLGLALDKEVDVVHVGVLNPAHLEITMLMLEHKKHVLCEKPMGLNHKQAQKMIECAQRNGVFLMEGIWSRSFPIYKILKEEIDNDTIGDVYYLYANIGQCLQNVERVSKRELGGGALLDLGIYTLQLAQLIFKNLKPTNLISAGHLSENGVDEAASAILTYPGRKTAVLSWEGCGNLENVAVVVGTKGTIKIPTFWCPTTIITPDKTLNFDLPPSSARLNHKNSQGLAYEIEHVRDCLMLGLLESPLMPHRDTLELISMMDSIRRDIGVIYEEDK